MFMIKLAVKDIQSMPLTCCAHEIPFKLVEKLFDDDFKQMWTMKFEKRCQKCNTRVPFQEGCNHLICRCGAEFCYLCGSKWKSCECPLFSSEDREVPGEGSPQYSMPKQAGPQDLSKSHGKRTRFKNEESDEFDRTPSAKPQKSTANPDRLPITQSATGGLQASDRPGQSDKDEIPQSGVEIGGRYYILPAISRGKRYGGEEEIVVPATVFGSESESKSQSRRDTRPGIRSAHPFPEQYQQDDLTKGLGERLYSADRIERDNGRDRMVFEDAANRVSKERSMGRRASATVPQRQAQRTRSNQSRHRNAEDVAGNSGSYYPTYYPTAIPFRNTKETKHYEPEDVEYPIPYSYKGGPNDLYA